MQVLLIILFNLVNYFRTLKYGYVCDDMVAARTVRKGKLSDVWGLVNGSLYWNNPEVEHLITLSIHTLNCSLIYLVFGQNTVSFVAALLFSVNPANNQGSVLLSGRMYQRFLTLTLVLAYFNLFWITLIPLYWLKMGENKRMKKDSTPIQKEISFRKLPLFFKTFGYYLRFCLLPTRLGMFHDFHNKYGTLEEGNDKALRWDREAFIGVSIFTILVCLAVNNFGIFWFILFIIPFCNFPRTFTQIIAERYVYIANVGLMLALSLLLLSLPYTLILIAVFLTYYVTRLHIHLFAYKDNESFIETGLYNCNFPNVSTSWLLRGMGEKESGYWYQALYSWTKGLNCNKKDSRIHFLLAQHLGALGNYKEALYHCDECEKYPIDVPNSVHTVIPILRKDYESKLKEGVK